MKELSAYKNQNAKQTKKFKAYIENNDINIMNQLSVSQEQDELLLALNMELLNLKYNLSEE
jgi:hypothetical protein